MKAAFLFLVVLNLAYLGWQTWIVPSQAPPALIETDNVPRLVLVDEDPNDPVFSEPYAPPKMTPQMLADLTAPKARLPIRSANQPVTEQSGTEQSGSGQSGTDQSGTEPQQTDEQSEEPVGTARAGNEAVAAAAAGGTETAVDTPQPDSPTSNPVEVAMAPAGLRCVSLGPFVNLRAATEATAMLIEAGLEPSQRLSESQVWFGHWVHLPPQESRAAAVAVVEQLREKGVSDIYIEPSGPMQNSISLGVFSDRKHAETRAGDIRRMGISPQIRDRYRDSSVYWVDFELPPGQVIDPTAYQASPRRVLRLEGRTCPEPT